MKKNLYIHIGTHKTATTYLQDFMLRNKDKLRENDIVYYGKCTKRDVSAGDTIRSDLYDYLDDAHNDESISSIIISDEDLCHNQPDTCDQIIEKYSDKFQIVIICYIRDIISYYISFYSYASYYYSTSSRKRPYRSFTEYIGKQSAYVSTHDMLFSLIEKIGKDNVIVRPFERTCFRDGRIDRDFFDIVGIDVSDFDEITSKNVSPSLKQAEMIFFAQSLTRIKAARRLARDSILNEFPKSDSSTITLEEVKSVYARYRIYEDNITQNFFPNISSKTGLKRGYTYWAQMAKLSGKDRVLSKQEKWAIMKIVVRSVFSSISQKINP